MAFLLFAGAAEHPKGGAADLVGRFPTLDAAIAAIDPGTYKYGWGHVLCLDSLKMVYSRFYAPGSGLSADDIDWENTLC